MTGRPFQFRLVALVWLVVVSAVICGTIRYIRASTGEQFLIVLLGTIIGIPLIVLFLLPNPFRGRPRKQPTMPEEPAAPIENRIEQFMSNVAPIEPSSTPGPKERLLPTSTDGKAARERGEIGHLLRRIHGEESSNSSQHG